MGVAEFILMVILAAAIAALAGALSGLAGAPGLGPLFKAATAAPGMSLNPSGIPNECWDINTFFTGVGLDSGPTRLRGLLEAWRVYSLGELTVTPPLPDDEGAVLVF